MSQPRMRKVVASGDGVPRARGSVTKASGDSVACTVRPNHETQRSRSKNKIPKSVRYDLENALVSLCDVWFEEIKPHLVRNNIKLHVHGSSAGGDHERPLTEEAPAHPAPHVHTAYPAHLAPNAPSTPGCSHLDPASSARVCELCRLLFNAANCIESAVSQAANAQPPMPPVATAVTTGDSTRLHSEKQQKRPRTRRKKRRSQPQPQSSWRVPRLCRTYSILTPSATGSRIRRIASHQLPQQPPCDDYYQFIVPRRSTVMKNKSTQTEEVFSRPSVSVGCQQEPPSASLAFSSLERRVRPRYNANSRAATSLSPPRERISQLKRPEPSAVEELPLFEDDLIDIIGERNDMNLRLLYSSPERDDYPSIMNLFPLHIERRKKSGGPKKSPPWR